MRRSVSALLSLSKRSTINLSTLVLCLLIFSTLGFAADAGRVALKGHRAPWAVVEDDQGAVPSDTMLEHLTVVLQRSPQQQKAFEKFLQQLQDPSSPNYHHFLTPVQVGKRFGASQQDIEAVSQWLSGQGLRVDSVANSRMMIDFSGNAAQVGAAFATEMHYYMVAGEQRIATAADPQIPATFAGIIQSVSGLHTLKNRSYHGTGQAYKEQGAGFTVPASTFCTPTCNNFIFPADFATIYDVPAPGLGIDGTGQNIGIIGRARVYNPDIENFQFLSGLAQKDPTVIIAGTDPGPADGTVNPAPGDQLEATLDVMRATSIAPGATVDLIASAGTQTEDGIAVAAQYAVDTNPVPAHIMNISFGLCEADVALADAQFWDTLFSAAAMEGISVFVASGDAGVAGCDTYFATPPATQVASPNYICASSYSTCVGGTEFADTANPAQYWNQNPVQSPPFESALGNIPEGGWNEPLNGSQTEAAASGGGVSSFFPTPSWQTGTGVPGARAGRYTPDLAFSSSGHDGYFGCIAADLGSCVVSGGSFSFLYFFGTSAAAPDMAGITALLNQKLAGPQGELNQRLYALAAVTPTNNVFHDATVTSSGVSGCVVTTPSMCNNSTPSPTALTGGLAGYLLTAGFDEVTGLGSIDVGNLLANYSSLSATTTTLVSSLNPAKFGVAVTFTATVATAGTNPPTGTVTFDDGTTSLGTGTLNGSLVATLTTSTLASGSHSITAVYGGDANNASSTSAVLTQTITAPDFTLKNTGSTTATVLAGVSGVGYAFTVAPVAPAATFGATVTFACSGLDATTSCVFNPASIAATAGSTSVTLTITTSGPNTVGANAQHQRADNRLPWLPFTLPIAGVVMLGLAGRKVSRYSAIVGLCLALGLIGLLIACGGSSTPISVTSVTPGSVSLWPNSANWPVSKQAFTATVSNNSAVNWSISPSPAGSSIDASGNYTAPTVAAGLPPTVTVTATSQSDSTKSNTATVTLKTATVPQTFSNVVVTVTDTTTPPTTHTLAPLTLVVQ
jgi:pseudomonalisin